MRKPKTENWLGKSPAKSTELASVNKASKNAGKKKGDVNSLSSWSDILEKQDKDRQRKEDALVKNMQEALPGAIKNLKKTSNVNLLNLLESWVSSGNPAVIECNQKFRNAVKAEILRRLDNA